jgi:leader peptidase (prepilin peptidase) / N-methyltransferase
VPPTLVAAAVGAGVGLVLAPYLARLTLSVPDHEDQRWWRGRPATSHRLAATAGVGVVLGTLAGAAGEWTARLPALIWLAVLCTPLAIIDIEHHRLPNRLVFLADIGAVCLGVFAAAVRDEWPELLRAAEGAAVVFALLFLLCLVSPKAFGYGDVKLGGLLGGYLGYYGWLYVYYGIFGGFLLGAVVGVGLILVRRAGMKTAVPFGPSMILGALIVLAFDLAPSLTGG